MIRAKTERMCVSQAKLQPQEKHAFSLDGPQIQYNHMKGNRRGTSAQTTVFTSSTVGAMFDTPFGFSNWSLIEAG